MAQINGSRARLEPDYSSNSFILLLDPEDSISAEEVKEHLESKNIWDEIRKQVRYVCAVTAKGGAAVKLVLNDLAGWALQSRIEAILENFFAAKAPVPA